jgi:hypothetical protein
VPGLLKYRAIAAGIGSVMLVAAMAVSPSAGAGVTAAPLPRPPLPQALAQLHGSRSSGKAPSSSHTAAYLTGVSALSASDAWAVGWEQPSSSSLDRVTLIEHWNGKSWTRAASPNPAGTEDAELEAVTAISAIDMWAVGYYFCPPGSGGACTTRTLTEHWNGKSWKIVPSPNPTSSANAPTYELYGVTAVSTDDVWAVGAYVSSPDHGTGLVEHWNGKAWKAVTSANAGSGVGLSGVAAVSATDVWAVGSGSGGTVVEHWNGHQWSSVHSPSPTPAYSNLYAVAAVSAKDVWAVGNDLLKNGSPYEATLIEHWNGAKWQHISSPNPKLLRQSCPTRSYCLNGLISVDALSADNVWAVGLYGSLSTYVDTLVEHWNGKSWSIVASLNTKGYINSALQGVSGSSASNIWSIGVTCKTGCSGSNDGPLYEKWNGHQWVINSSG